VAYVILRISFRACVCLLYASSTDCDNWSITMKYTHLAFPIIPVGVLVLGCFFTSPLRSPGQEQPKTHVGPYQTTVQLPNFVRPNEPLEVQSTPATSITHQTPTITVTLLTDTSNKDVQYSITADDNSTDTTTHYLKTSLTDIAVCTVGGEVIIYGHDTTKDHKWVAFVSRCRPAPRNDKDYDVDWFPQ
jgi:hypothetical protein